jgi:hypothetical protein
MSKKRNSGFERKKNAGFKKNADFLLKKNVELLHLLIIWTDVKIDAFTSEKTAGQM